MSVSTLNVFRLDALEANRRGELTEEQLQAFRDLSRSRHRSSFSGAALLVAGGVLVGFFASPTAPVTSRVLIASIAFAIAAVLLLRAIFGLDALTRDVRQPRVESAEGAIGKRRYGGSGGPASDRHFLDVGDQTFKVARSTYAAAPDHGFVRLYFLPRSRKIVNLERLADPPLPDPENLKGMLDSIGAAWRAPKRSTRNEARAVIGSVEDALEASRLSSSASVPPDAGNTRPLVETIVGTWSNPLMRVSFSSGGRVVVHTFGMTREGHWSVDHDGRLRSDITGKAGTAEAWVVGDKLTISAGDQGMTFTRES